MFWPPSKFDKADGFRVSGLFEGETIKGALNEKQFGRIILFPFNDARPQVRRADGGKIQFWDCFAFNLERKSINQQPNRLAVAAVGGSDHKFPDDPVPPPESESSHQ